MYKNVSCRLTFQSRIKIPKMSEYFSILIYLLCFLKAKFMKQSQRCFIPRLHQTVNSSKIKIIFYPCHDCLTDLICITLPLVFRCNDITHLNNFFFSQHAIVDSGSSNQPVGTSFLFQPCHIHSSHTYFQYMLSGTPPLPVFRKGARYNR